MGVLLLPHSFPQYALMFAHAGQPGTVKTVQATVSKARKVFRVGKPLTSLSGFVAPKAADDPPAVDLLKRVKALLMANYFFFDHIVWAHQVGLVKGGTAEGQRKFQRISLFSWMYGSIATGVLQAVTLVRLSTKLSKKLKAEKDPDAKQDLKEAAQHAAKKQMYAFCHAAVQTTLAMGLLDLLPLGPRTNGGLGMVSSLMQCYLLFPGTFPDPKPKAKAE